MSSGGSRSEASAAMAIELAARELGFGLLRAERCSADAEIGKSDIRQSLAVGARAGRQAHDGIVAAAVGEFCKADSAQRGGGREPDCHQHVPRRERGLEQSLEEIVS